jgi:hypothetical protein
VVENTETETGRGNKRNNVGVVPRSVLAVAPGKECRLVPQMLTR